LYILSLYTLSLGEEGRRKWGKGNRGRGEEGQRKREGRGGEEWQKGTKEKGEDPIKLLDCGCAYV